MNEYDLRPESSFVNFFLNTRFLRVIGRRIFPYYKARLPNSDVIILRSQFDWDAATVSTVFKRNVYESMFSVNKGDTIIDAGAHIGSFSLKAAKETGAGGSVVAIEPSSENFRMLTKNIRLNGYSNVHLLNAAAGDHSGFDTLRIYERRGGNSFFVQKFKQVGGEKVEILTLDSIIETLKLATVNFVKIDVEGSELNVLKGANRILGSFHPKIVMETHPFGPPAGELTSYLKKYNYEKTYLTSSKLGLGMLYAF